MTGVLDFAYSLVDFFGCRLDSVNPILLRLGLKNDRPEWLRLRPKLVDLPRWGAGEHIIPITSRITPSEVAERLVWVVEELEGEWYMTPKGFHFADVKECVHFKLRWT